MSTGDFAIPGVPGTGARIDLEWIDPAGSLTGKRYLPTGNPRDSVTLRDGRQFTISIVDAGNLTVFCDASELGLQGTELPAEFDANKELQATIEELRLAGGELCGVQTAGMPKIGFFAAPKSAGMDITARLMSAQLMHKSYMGAGAVCTSAAAAIEGTIVHGAAVSPARTGAKECELVRIGHPAGVMDSTVKSRRGKRRDDDRAAVRLRAPLVR